MILPLIISITLLPACDSALKKNPPSQFASSNVFSDEKGVDAAVKGIYDAVRGNSYYDQFHIGELLFPTDYVFGRGSQNPPSVFDLDETNINRMSVNIWDPAYSSINRSNIVIANIQAEESIEDLNEARRNQFIGEARFLRALNYFNLVRLFGGPNGEGVPLRLKPSESSEENINVPRASKEEVYSQIIEDLQFAEQNLPGSYTEASRGRATRWAVKALLSKVHLTLENWSMAESKADEIINSGEFELLVPDDTSAQFEEIFGQNAQAGVTNNETIFEISFAPPSVGNNIGQFFHSATSSYYPSGFFAWYGNIDICRVEEAFDEPLNRPEDCGPPGGQAEKESFIGPWHAQRDVDRRANFTLYDPTRVPDKDMITPQTPMFFRKYKSGDTYNAGNPIPLFRYAEILLIKSEAEFRQNGATDEAREYLNMIRRRARGLDPMSNSTADVSTTLSGSAFLDTLLLERAKEFAAEGAGKRYYDLIRTEKNGELRGFWLAKELGKGTPERKNFNWPIPSREINNNDAITQEDQNPGW